MRTKVDQLRVGAIVGSLLPEDAQVLAAAAANDGAIAPSAVGGQDAPFSDDEAIAW